MATAEPRVRKLRACWLGRRRYGPVLALQERLSAERQQGRVGDTLLLLEHEPVITLGRGAKPEHLLATAGVLSARGVDVVSTGRGGDVTYHGPGQLVGYPILDLAPDRCDVRRYVHDLLATMQGVVAPLGVDAGVIDRFPGIWVDLASPEAWPGPDAARSAAKLGAVGVRITRWVTMHGFALNVQTRMQDFDLIVPCGIREYGVTSLAGIVASCPTPKALAKRAAEVLGERMEVEALSFEEVNVPDGELMAALGVAT